MKHPQPTVIHILAPDARERLRRAYDLVQRAAARANFEGRMPEGGESIHEEGPDDVREIESG